MRDDETDDVAAASTLLPGLELEPDEILSDGERSTVRRVRAVDEDGAPRSLIVKTYHAEDEGWARESAALASVPGWVRTPELIAVGDDPRLIVMEDLGGTVDVAQALLDGDPDDAAAAIVDWAAAVADLHVATAGSRAAFRSALDTRGGENVIAESAMPTRIRDAERILDRDCGALGVTIPVDALDELTGLVTRLGGEDTAALTPADACPENNVRMANGRLVLVDFEGAQWRHIAWDAAYLHVPWPTCRCAWRMPDDVIAAATRRYREIAAAAFPAVAEDSFTEDLDAATTGWCVITTAWQLDHALGAGVDLDQPVDVTRPSPSRRALIMHRLGVASCGHALPALAELAGNLRAALIERWGDVDLDLAPVFRDRGDA